MAIATGFLPVNLNCLCRHGSKGQAVVAARAAAVMRFMGDLLGRCMSVIARKPDCVSKTHITAGHLTFIR